MYLTDYTGTPQILLPVEYRQVILDRTRRGRGDGMRVISRIAATVVMVIATAVPVLAQEPIRFTEGPYDWDFVYPAGWLCDFPVHVVGDIEISHVWKVADFPPAADEEWESISHFSGAETWTNVDNTVSGTDRYNYTIQHEWIGSQLIRTFQSGVVSNVAGTGLTEAGRLTFQGDDLLEPTDVRGNWVQYPEFMAWIDARCAALTS